MDPIKATELILSHRKIRRVEMPNKKTGMTTYRGDAMTSQAIYDMLAKRAQEAGIKNVSPGNMRRSFISHLLDAGAEIATVSRMAGNASMQSIARYDRRPEEVKRKVLELLHVPHKTRKVGPHEP